MIPTKYKFLLLIFFSALCVLFIESDALAIEESSRGRIIWDNVMRWINFGIMVSGKAQPFLQPAFEENAERIFQALGQAVSIIVTEAGNA